MSKEKLSEDEVMGLKGLALIFALCAVGLLIAWGGTSDVVKYVNKPVNQCTNTKEVIRTDLEKVYCGKACRRYAVEYTYWCEREKKQLIFVE